MTFAADVLHSCDVIEDVAIAYGFNNIDKTIPNTNCVAHQVSILLLSLKLHLLLSASSEQALGSIEIRSSTCWIY